jgi:hypothetical protein
MNRESLLKRLVDRKLATCTKDKVFCVCMVDKARNLCFAGKPLVDGGRPGSPNPK